MVSRTAREQVEEAAREHGWTSRAYANNVLRLNKLDHGPVFARFSTDGSFDRAGINFRRVAGADGLAEVLDELASPDTGPARREWLAQRAAKNNEGEVSR